MFQELNNGAKVLRAGINTEGMEFTALKEYVGRELRVDGFFFSNAGNYGKQVVVVADGKLINMPKRAVEQFEKIYNSKEKTQGVIDGHLKLTDIRMIDTKNGTTTSYTFTDC